MAKNIRDIKEEIRNLIVVRDDAYLKEEDVEEQILETVLDKTSLSYMHLRERYEVISEIRDSIIGLDILEPLMNDREVDEIMVMGHNKIYTERHGRLVKETSSFYDEERLMHLIYKVANGMDRQVNQSNPIADLRLPNGARVNVVLPPISMDGPVVTIRKFSPNPFTLQKLIELGSVTEEQACLLRQLVYERKNIFVSGGTGTGKTSLLNALSREIPGDQRVVTIEDSAELMFTNVDNLVRLECRTANVEGQGEVSMDQLIRTALRLRPDRIIVGEVRGAEVVSMLQAMNTGHLGSMSTGHGNSPEDMLRRLETMFLMGMEIPLQAVRRQIGSAIDYIVHLERTREYGRKVTGICKVIEDNENKVVRVC